MKLTVLGKYGPYPKAGDHAASGYLVTDGGAALALDLGPGTMARLTERIDLRALDALVLSHLHYDHTSDLLPLRYRLEELETPLTVYAQTDDTPWCRLLFDHPLLRVVPVADGSVEQIHGLTLRFFAMRHTVPCLAVRIEGSKTLVYTGDTMMNDNLPRAAAGADLLLADCAKPAGFRGPHMTAPEAIELQENLQIPILATHLSPDYDPAPAFAACPGISVAQELHTYEI